MKTKPKAKTPRPTRRQRALARGIADALFTNGVGQTGNRLVLTEGVVFDVCLPAGRGAALVDLAHWTPEAVADLIAGRLAGAGQ